MLEHHRQSHRLVPRQTIFQLVDLYDQLLRATALEWLQRHYPDDVDEHLERAISHKNA